MPGPPSVQVTVRVQWGGAGVCKRQRSDQMQDDSLTLFVSWEGAHYVQDGFELAIPRPQPLQCWDYRHAPLSPAPDIL
jgi:hypothetical protein